MPYLNKANTDIISHAAAKPLRPVLNGVYIKNNKTVATDSFRLLEVECSTAEDVPSSLESQGVDDIIIPLSALAKAGKNIPQIHRTPALENIAVNKEDNTATLSTTDLETQDDVKTRIIDGKFPEYKQAFPEDEPLAEIYLDASYVKDMADYFKKHDKDGKMKIQLFSKDSKSGSASKPCVFLGKTEHDQKIRGVIMPFGK